MTKTDTFKWQGRLAGQPAATCYANQFVDKGSMTQQMKNQLGNINKINHLFLMWKRYV